MAHSRSQKALSDKCTVKRRPYLAHLIELRRDRRAFLEKIAAEIDAEIARLQTVKRLLSPPSVSKKRGAGGPATTESALAPEKSRKRRRMSRAAREKIRQAQLKRWAAKKSARAPVEKTAA